MFFVENIGDVYYRRLKLETGLVPSPFYPKLQCKHKKIRSSKCYECPKFYKMANEICIFIGTCEDMECHR